LNWLTTFHTSSRVIG